MNRNVPSLPVITTTRMTPSRSTQSHKSARQFRTIQSPKLQRFSSQSTTEEFASKFPSFFIYEPSDWNHITDENMSSVVIPALYDKGFFSRSSSDPTLAKLYKTYRKYEKAAAGDFPDPEWIASSWKMKKILQRLISYIRNKIWDVILEFDAYGNLHLHKKDSLFPFLKK